MSRFFSLSSAGAALVAVALGVAAPARGETAQADDEEAPTIAVPPAPRPAASISDPDVPPLMPRWVHRRRPALIVAGAATYGLTYAAAVFLGLGTLTPGVVDDMCTSDCRSQATTHAATMVVPIAGPVLYWWKTPDDSRGSPVFWSIWSGVQAVGAGMLIAGLVGHDVMEWRPRYLGATVRVVPAVAPTLGALSLAVTW